MRLTSNSVWPRLSASSLANHRWHMLWSFLVSTLIQLVDPSVIRLRILGVNQRVITATLSWPTSGSKSKLFGLEWNIAELNFLLRIRFVYQVVVPKAMAPKKLVAVFESGEKVVLPPWDPMVCSFLVPRCAVLDTSFRAHWREGSSDINYSWADGWIIVPLESPFTLSPLYVLLYTSPTSSQLLTSRGMKYEWQRYSVIVAFLRWHCSFDTFVISVF